jgi:steroid 5-alpha reductase family enzyme
MQELAAMGLLVALGLAIPVWALSLKLRDASLADRIWPLLIAAPALVCARASGLPVDTRGALMLGLLLLWAVRLAGYIGLRNWGAGEDRRYRAMRARHEPNFGLKSLYLVFGLQAVLAWVVGWPMLAVLQHPAPLTWLDLAGLALAGGGLLFEAVADAQLARFLRERPLGGSVMSRGLWAWSRHPNYFGEACVWWGFGLMAFAAGGLSCAWALVSPLLMTVLLLKVSGVALLERDIAERRPDYRDYAARTSAFIPWPPRRETRS